MTRTDEIQRTVAHRPWPLPPGPWIMFQSWRELLFAHWQVPAEGLRALIPAELQLDTFGGSAWVGQTPFRLCLRPRFLPVLPTAADFPEMNLRTYVTVGGKPGIFFFTLEAASPLAVMAARAFYRLPYHLADMRIESRGGWFHYRSRRREGDVEFQGRYRPSGPVFRALPGTLEYFLTERYALYVVLRNGKVLRGDIHHLPWPLQQAEAEIDRNTVPVAHGISPPTGPPFLLYSGRIDTLVWPPVFA